MQITEYLKQNILYLDGGLGTLLQEMGLKPGEYPERWNITNPKVLQIIHKDYFDAGSNVVNTNTFGANALKFDIKELEDIIKAAIENVKIAREKSTGTQPKFVALDIGPLGKMLKPYGDLDFEDAVEIFAKTVRIGVKYGVDLVCIETMNDSYETKAALLAVKENCDLPVFVTNAYGEDGKLMTGASPKAMCAMLEGMHADAIGVNCSLGPKQLKNIVKELLEVASVPVIVKPNAGLPKSVDGKTVFDVESEEFAKDVADMVCDGALIVGGCCGTTPEFIKELVKSTKNLKPKCVEKKNLTWVSSYTNAVVFGDLPILIGERINPTGKKMFKQALRDNDINYILQEGIRQAECGVHVLDVNVGLPEIDEVKMLKEAVCSLQSVVDLPLQIDTSDPLAMETAMRVYNGKAMINSVNGKQESMKTVFPLVQKYGGLVVALTLDENGIPSTAEGRYKIAENILKTAKEYGIDKNDIIFDTLAMTISADKNAAQTTLDALSMIKNQLGCHTSLGVSNVSFGLPARDVVNSVFFATALENGLSAGIMNPYSDEMLKAYYSYKALHGMDDNCAEYIDFMTNTSVSVTKESKKDDVSLQYAIKNGLKDVAAKATVELLKTVEPLDIVKNEIVPALDSVGNDFESNRVFLPQLLMSAEGAKSAFEVIKKYVTENKTDIKNKCKIIIATVYGDVHDIGKNIVKLLLENYGYDVVDMGKNVPPEEIVKEVTSTHAPLVCLSALMTTTVPAMEETIKLIREYAPWCKVVVGGAVLTQDYADKIGADKYAKDAMEAVRYAETIN